MASASCDDPSRESARGPSRVHRGGSSGGARGEEVARRGGAPRWSVQQARSRDDFDSSVIQRPSFRSEAPTSILSPRVAWPRRHAKRVDFRRGEVGDPKWIWELNRCRDLPLLAPRPCLPGTDPTRTPPASGWNNGLSGILRAAVSRGVADSSPASVRSRSPSRMDRASRFSTSVSGACREDPRVALATRAVDRGRSVQR